MTRPYAAILPCGDRLHLQHGPIDLVIGADERRHEAFDAAARRFETVLIELVEELAELRKPLTSKSEFPRGDIAFLMDQASRPFSQDHFITPMVAVAGAVADTILQAMLKVGPLKRAYVNNGGDIAIHLDGEQEFTTAISSHDGTELGRIALSDRSKINGIASSGRFGRSFSLGIADNVTVLAETAVKADAAATLIANAVDLPNHASISRVPACSLYPDSDLGERLIVTNCNSLSRHDQRAAVLNGERKAQGFCDRGLIAGAAIFLQNENCLVGSHHLDVSERTANYA